MSELDKFREVWRQEVADRVRVRAKQQSEPDSSSSSARLANSNNVRTLQLSENQIPRAEVIKKNLGGRADEVEDSIAPASVSVDGHFRAERPSEVYLNKDLSETDLTALELFEKAVDKEHVGSMSDAVRYYRDAYKKSHNVDKLYREKYYSKHKPVVHREPIEEDQLLKSLEKMVVSPEKESKTTEEPDEEVEEGPIMMVPMEILVLILQHVALDDLSSFTKATYTCKKFAYVGYKSQSIWKALCYKEYSSQHYGEETISEYGTLSNEELVEKFWKSSWRKMYLERPRVWFNGVYISTCNYLRPGVAETWSNPVHMVTYYRYCRFFENGTCINLLTTAEPSEVVPVFNSHSLSTKGKTTQQQLTKYTKEDGTPLVIPKGITCGTWKIESSNGRILIETEGSVDKYTFFMNLQIRSSGKNRHNKLKWIAFWNVNTLTQNRGEFTLKHDKAYFFVRTRL